MLEPIVSLWGATICLSNESGHISLDELIWLRIRHSLYLGRAQAFRNLCLVYGPTEKDGTQAGLLDIVDGEPQPLFFIPLRPDLEKYLLSLNQELLNMFRSLVLDLGFTVGKFASLVLRNAPCSSKVRLPF